MKSQPFYILKALLLSILVLGFSSCVTDDIDPCKFHLRVKYDYNMDYVDKFPTQAKRINIFVFDAQGVFVRQIDCTADPKFSDPFVVDIEVPTAKLGQDFTFLAWVGLNAEYISTNTFIEGETKIEDVEVMLKKTSNSNKTDQKFEPMMYGKLTTEVDAGKSASLSLVKNTNSLLLSVQSKVEETEEIYRVEKYTIFIESANAHYNFNNQLMHSPTVHYYPYLAGNIDNGFNLELNTFRLLESEQNYLVILSKEYGHELLRVDLNKLFNNLRIESSINLPLQEYLDREDQFTIVLLVGDELNTDPFKKFQVYVNGWLVRTQITDN